MKIIYVIVLKVIIPIIFVLALGISITILIGALQEKTPEHPLDFQDIKKTVLDKPINSVEDGLPYALNRAREWRQDAVLTGLEIVSVGKDEILNNKGKLNYIFEFEYVDKNKPGGIITVSIDTNSNSIELVSASHDGEDRTRRVKELKHNDLEESVRKVYYAAIKAIGNDNVFKYQQPFVRIRIGSDFAIFEESYSQDEPNKIENRVKIDMKTYNILD